jgi:hypothetical protein
VKKNSGQPTIPLFPEAETQPVSEGLKFDKIFRIAVSGDVLLTELERRIVDTKDFQRLRRVRQLGTVCFVYPTALHTRFDHCLGALAMADRMVMQIRNNTASLPEEKDIPELDRAITRIYALLHDIPHVPFGHTIEDELRLLERHDENPKRITRFLGPQSEIGQLISGALGDETYERFMAVYLWDADEDKIAEKKNDEAWKELRSWLTMRHDDVYIHDIVSNTVCADLLDYLQRDNYFCNLGINLEYRFLNFLYLHRPDGDPDARRRVFVRLWKGRQRAPRRDTLTDLARLLEARYMLAERAYFHHTKIITGAMLGRALQESFAAGEISEESLYEHSDDSLLHQLQGSKAAVAQSLAKRLLSRQLLKAVDVFDDTSFRKAQHNDHEIKFKDHALAELKNPEQRRIYEDALAEKIGVEAGSILIYAPPSGMNLKLAHMNVRWSGGDMPLCKIDDPVISPRLKEILKAHELLWGIWLIGDSTLTDTQKTILVEDFKLTYLANRNSADIDERKIKHVESLFDLALAASDAKFNGSISDFCKKKRDQAKEYLAASTDKRSHKARIASSIKKIIEG